jgi:hypothetical protein
LLRCSAYGRVWDKSPFAQQARLKELIEQAIVDAYGEEEQVADFFTMIEEHLALPFRVKVLGVDASP